MNDETPVASSIAEFTRMFGHLPHPEPGDDCYACNRPVPKISRDARNGSKRSVVSIAEPKGEEGTLESLMIGVVDRFQDQWPRDFAAMRNGIGLEVVGGRAWKYYVTHFALYAALTVPGLEPTE